MAEDALIGFDSFRYSGKIFWIHLSIADNSFASNSTKQGTEPLYIVIAEPASVTVACWLNLAAIAIASIALLRNET